MLSRRNFTPRAARAYQSAGARARISSGGIPNRPDRFAGTCVTSTHPLVSRDMGHDVTHATPCGCSAPHHALRPRNTQDVARAQRTQRHAPQHVTRCCCVGVACVARVPRCVRAPWRGRNGWDGPRGGGGACGGPIARSPARTWGPGISRSRTRGVKEIQRSLTQHVTRHRLIVGES